MKKEDLQFTFCSSLSADKCHSLMYQDEKHGVRMEVHTTGRTVGGMFKPKKETRCYYRAEMGSKIHDSIDSLLDELNGDKS